MVQVALQLPSHNRLAHPQICLLQDQEDSALILCPTDGFTPFGLGVGSAHLSEVVTPDGTPMGVALWGFFKSSMLYLSIYMEHSLRLRFYLRHSLGGYTVDTIAGFTVKIMEALSP
jgi:hypothetical protein